MFLSTPCHFLAVLVANTRLSKLVETRAMGRASLGGMENALGISRLARVIAPPNPWVGCTIYADGELVGSGSTRAAGGWHAERVALAEAGEHALGATMYVTLEPCSHTGRTPPCTQAIISAGIRKVYVGTVDPDLQVRGAGLSALSEAGIEVNVGLMEEEIVGELAPYIKHRSTAKPWVVLKLAMSLDGKIAAQDGGSTWITAEAARESVHRRRSQVQAVLVGAGTARQDDPRLTARLHGNEEYPRQPRRLVYGKIPSGAKLLPGEEVSGDVETLLLRLATEGVLELMVEGGSGVAGAFHDAREVDEYLMFIAPAILGGGTLEAIGGKGTEVMAEALRGEFVTIRRVGADLEVAMFPCSSKNLLTRHMVLSKERALECGAQYDHVDGNEET